MRPTVSNILMVPKMDQDGLEQERQCQSSDLVFPTFKLNTSTTLTLTTHDGHDDGDLDDDDAADDDDDDEGDDDDNNEI